MGEVALRYLRTREPGVGVLIVDTPEGVLDIRRVRVSDPEDRRAASEAIAALAPCLGDAGAVERALTQLARDAEVMRTRDGHGDSTASRLARLALERGEVYQDADTGEVWWVHRLNGCREAVPLDSAQGRRALAALLAEVKGKTPPRSAIEDACNVLAGRALKEHRRGRSWRRIAHPEPGVIYLDLARDGLAVRITADGWEVVQDPPVAFYRPPTMLPLPVPRRGQCSALDYYTRGLNLAREAGLALAVFSLVAFLPAGTFPALVLLGPEEAGKSTCALAVKSLVDPERALASPPQEARDWKALVGNRYVVAVDNISRVSDWWLDCLCRITSGGMVGGRRLYTDMDEAVVYARQPVILTSIQEDIITRPDFATRCLPVDLPPVTSTSRRRS